MGRVVQLGGLVWLGWFERTAQAEMSLLTPGAAEQSWAAVPSVILVL